MKFVIFSTLAVIGTLLCGAAQASRPIAYDCGQYTNAASGPFSSSSWDDTSASVTIDGISLSISSGTGPTFGNVSQISCAGFGSNPTSSVTEFMAEGPAYTGGSGGDVPYWQAYVTPVSNNANSDFTVELLYPATQTGDTGCLTDTASLTLSTGGSYSSKGACAGAGNQGLGDYLFTFSDKGALLSGGFSSTTVAAPEIDATSAASGLALLVGVLAVMTGRRRTV